MYKILIVDDEPLVQVGIKSMIDWSEYGVEVCDTAFNGEQAYAIIQDKQPDIILSDIKMPIMTGLELLKKCHKQISKPPVFIFLTSYEEFGLIREAMRYDALDYLIKLDITPKSLGDVITKAVSRLNELTRHYQVLPSATYQQFYGRFMTRLLNNLFDDMTQFNLQTKELGIDFDASSYSICLCSIIDSKDDIPLDKLRNLYASAGDMVGNLVGKHIDCHMISLEPKRFCILLKHESTNMENQNQKIRSALNHAFDMVERYFNLNLYASIGRSYESPLHICNSYQDARHLLPECNHENPIICYSESAICDTDTGHTTFNLGIFKNEIRLAFESYDPEAFNKTLMQLIELFEGQNTMYLQAIDAAVSLLHMTSSMLPNSSSDIEAIFASYPDNYRSIYTYTRLDPVIEWLMDFCDGITGLLKSQNKNYKNHMITSIRNYVDQHIKEKLTLNDVASLYGISPNYLSNLFKKTCEIGFSDYVTSKKMALAKVMLTQGGMKVYEVADALGYESAFYFSKVFKKVEGCPPSAFPARL